MSNVTPFYGATVIGKSRDEIVGELATHLVNGEIDLDDEDNGDIVACLLDAPERYGWKIVKAHMDDAVLYARNINALRREFARAV
ncbi:MAG: hypothetical protein CFE29_02970 [Bradyrhizobiaceae bacterium PARB1]|nr:MAG: hypothetical protein CFE29_02970 [Bradyrhizobiaceae bacterium PARB1]